MAEVVLNVAAKVVLANPSGNILIVRESSKHDTNTKAGRYQLPGGRLERGEPFFEALTREVLEETGLSIVVGDALLVGEWWPVIKGVPHQIIGMFLAATTTQTEVHISEEHDEHLWIEPHKWREYDIIPPDTMAIDAYNAALARGLRQVKPR